MISPYHYDRWAHEIRETGNRAAGWYSEQPFARDYKTHEWEAVPPPPTDAEKDLVEQLHRLTLQLRAANIERYTALVIWYGAYPGAIRSLTARVKHIDKSNSTLVNARRQAEAWIEGLYVGEINKSA